MKKTRIFAFLLAGIILSATCTSCLKKDDVNNKNGDGNKDNVESNQTEDGTLNVPKGACDGKTFSLYIANPDVKHSYIAKEETGDDLNDAVFERNSLVESHTGVELNFVASSRTSAGNDQTAETNQIRTWIQSGDNTYDAYVHVQHSGMPTLIQEGLFVDWNELPYVNIQNEWWYSNVQRDICYGNKIYCMTGDYNLSSFSGAECIIFNKTMCDELELEYPYQMVFDGTWTHDKLVEYTKAATKDLNGDGVLKREDDRFGYAGWYPEIIPALFCGYGGQAISKDEDNLPVLNVDNERTYNVVDKMLEVFDLDGAFVVTGTYGEEDKMFDEGRLLFNDAFLSAVPRTRGLENIDVGFIPYPKIDEDQEEYYTRTANISCLTYIPVTNDDLEKTGAVLESLAYYSSQTVLPTYFDIILSVKSARDVESEQMIPIIRKSARFLETVIGFTPASIITAGSGNTLSSVIASNKDAWELKVEEFIETYTNDD